IPFHWMVEFPEVFYGERPDPLDGGRTNGAAWVDGFVGNPPFAGKNSISATCGPAYIDWLMSAATGAHGNTDISAYFLRFLTRLLGRHGTFGFITTNTIAQGDTRQTGLRALVKHGPNIEIYSAVRLVPWPGDAAVVVSTVHVATGQTVKTIGAKTLDGKEVDWINTLLRGFPERPDPVKLSACQELSFAGAKLFGQGFVLTAEERDDLVRSDPRSTDVIQPYVG